MFHGTKNKEYIDKIVIAKINQSNYMSFRDTVYENNNLVNDMNGLGIKCKNYELCQCSLMLDHFKMVANYLCTHCGDWFKISGFGWNELEFKDCNEECDVCSENVNRKLKFPTNCGHWFCISCSRKILFYDASRYHINPVLYGCPPCPNNCVNPDKGPQCGCVEYDEILDKWEKDFPDKYTEWNDVETESIEIGDESGSTYGTCKCPLCRKEYKRK